MRAFALAAAVVAATLCPQLVRAACTVPPPPVKTVTVEAGASRDAVTKGPAWEEQSLSIASRDGNRFSAYGRFASDTRFGSTDPSYEAGVYSALGPHLIANVEGAFSPTHDFLPATTETGGLDWRTNGGYGYQSQFTQRNYATQIAGITTLGADRYAGVNRYALGVTLANLSSVPGTAVTVHGAFARYLACDDETFSVSGGRDVEPTGVAGQVAVYQSYSYDVNDVHWFTPRTALNAGAAWILLIGAYDRFELRLALRERL